METITKMEADSGTTQAAFEKKTEQISEIIFKILSGINSERKKEFKIDTAEQLYDAIKNHGLNLSDSTESTYPEKGETFIIDNGHYNIISFDSYKIGFKKQAGKYQESETVYFSWDEVITLFSNGRIKVDKNECDFKYSIYLKKLAVCKLEYAAELISVINGTIQLASSLTEFKIKCEDLQKRQEESMALISTKEQEISSIKQQVLFFEKSVSEKTTQNDLLVLKTILLKNKKNQ